MKKSTIQKSVLAALMMSSFAGAADIYGQVVCDEEWDGQSQGIEPRVAQFISVPGTSYISTFDSDGYFKISGVRRGIHELEIMLNYGWVWTGDPLELEAEVTNRGNVDMGVINICEWVIAGNDSE